MTSEYQNVVVDLVVGVDLDGDGNVNLAGLRSAIEDGAARAALFRRTVRAIDTAGETVTCTLPSPSTSTFTTTSTSTSTWQVI